MRSSSTGKINANVFTKQADIDNILKITQRKVIKGTHSAVTVKEIQAGYLISPYLKKILISTTK